jgi:hypothetical protein
MTAHSAIARLGDILEAIEKILTPTRNEFRFRPQLFCSNASPRHRRGAL